MTHSKLEKYLNILEILVFRPLEFENVLCQIGEQWNTLKKYLSFLIEQSLVEKLPLGEGRVVYTVTEKGLSILRVLQGQKFLEEPENFMLLLEE